MSAGFRLRITYAIRGRLAYLSHLETVEAMRRIVRRSQLPYAVTQGFSPHMKVSLGPALPVGASGEEERFDVYMTHYVPADIALARLLKAAPQNLVPTGVEYVACDAPALDVELCVSTWQARFACGQGAGAHGAGEGAHGAGEGVHGAGEGGHGAGAAAEALTAAFGELVERGYIEVVKHKRAKTVTKKVEFEGKLIEPPRVFIDEANVAASFATRQEKEGALRPDLFIDAALDLVCERVGSIELVSLVRERLSA